MAQSGFNDPLRNFNWAGLYARYDEMCAAFNPHSPLLAMFEPALPSSDRALYYKLAGAFETIRADHPAEMAALYGAMLYWKLYSQHRVRGKIIGWTEEAREPLARLLQTMPVDVEPHQEDIAELERRVLSFGIPGMKSPTAIPVRATLLHFLYPNVAPLFDWMVLRAAGVVSKPPAMIGASTRSTSPTPGSWRRGTGTTAPSSARRRRFASSIWRCGRRGGDRPGFCRLPSMCIPGNGRMPGGCAKRARG